MPSGVTACSLRDSDFLNDESAIHREVEGKGSIVMGPAYADERFERMFLARIPRAVARSFSDEQLTAIKTVFGAEGWDHHRLDFRGMLWLPFRRWYYVFLAGPERRHRARPRDLRERSPMRRALGAATSAIVVIWLVLLVVYLLVPSDLLPPL